MFDKYVKVGTSRNKTEQQYYLQRFYIFNFSLIALMAKMERSIVPGEQLQIIDL